MNKTSIFIAASAAVALSGLVPQNANAVTLASWSFDGKTLFGGATLTSSLMGTGYTAEVGVGTMFGIHTVTNSVWSYPTGNGSTSSMSATGWTVGNSSWDFVVSTALHTAIKINFDQISSSTGPRNWKLQYKIGAGSFTDYTTYNVLANASPNVWASSASNVAYKYSFDLSAVTAIENQSSITFRLLVNGSQPAGTGTAAFPTTGTNRIDNASIEATPVPEPTTLAILAAGAGVAAARRRKKNS